MHVSFPRQPEEINDTDFDILRCLDRESPLWKMEITRRVNTRREGETVLDTGPVSKQAMARRIDRLHEEGFLRKTIMPPSRIESDVDIRKRFIMAYEPTDRGRDRLFEGVVAVLQEVAVACIGEDVVVDDFTGIDRLMELYGKKEGVEPSFDAFLAVECGLE